MIRKNKTVPVLRPNAMVQLIKGYVPVAIVLEISQLASDKAKKLRASANESLLRENYDKSLVINEA